jgi:hypothetical protein
MSRLALPIRLISGFCACCLIAAGCQREQTSMPGETSKTRQLDENLSPERARAALLRLLESDIPLGLAIADGPAIEKRLKAPDSVRSLKTEDAVVEGDLTFLGGWTCNLKERTFFTVLPWPGGHEYTVRGEFRKTPKGTWEAAVTGYSHGNVAPHHMPPEP